MFTRSQTAPKVADNVSQDPDAAFLIILNLIEQKHVEPKEITDCLKSGRYLLEHHPPLMDHCYPFQEDR